MARSGDTEAKNKRTEKKQGGLYTELLWIINPRTIKGVMIIHG